MVKYILPEGRKFVYKNSKLKFHPEMLPLVCCFRVEEILESTDFGDKFQMDEDLDSHIQAIKTFTMRNTFLRI